jgi:hypothetical protein
MSSTDRVGWTVALVTGVLTILSFFGLDKQSRAWICQETDGRLLCDKVRLEEVQVKMFALDFCYLHADDPTCIQSNTVFTNPLSSSRATALINESLRSLGNPEWGNNPPDNLRYYVPSHRFPRGTSRKYLLYWEIGFNTSNLDHPVAMRVVPYFYKPTPPGAEGYYGDPYDKAYQQTDSVDFVLKPGHEKLSRLLTVDAGQGVRLENVNDWPVGVYTIRFKLESDQAELPHNKPIDSTFQVYQVPVSTSVPTDYYYDSAY